jgi:glycosyltransferase involved in cell wall biosynthesis
MLSTFLRYVASSLGLFRELAGDFGDADVVHLSLPTPGFSLLADLLATRIRVPLVVGYEAPLISADLVDSVARAALRGLGFYLPRLLVNNALFAGAARHRADLYVVSSQYQELQLRRFGLQGRTAVIPNVVEIAPDDADARDPDEDPASARRRIGLPERAPLVGYVGHLHPVKGVDTLVRAFARLLVAHPDVRLVLAWSGMGDRAGIASLLERLGCSDRVIWLGRTNVSDLLGALDVLALPYRYPIGQNAFPNVLLESHAVGIPLVTTRIPVVEEACHPNETALLVPPDDPASMAAALDELLRSAARREAMVRQQRHRFAARFAPEALLGRYQALYRLALEVAGAVVADPTRPPRR